jgi:iron complex outermembrane receptor protein
MIDFMNRLRMLKTIFQVIVFSGLLTVSWMPRIIYAESITLDPIIVTAKTPKEPHQTGDVDKTSTPVFYHKIQRDEFEGKMEDLSEVVENQTGIQVRQTGGLGSFSTISLRGASSEQVMVYLDGILLNDASGGGVDLSNISLSDVESIEIYRGISPINFNKASIGGVVNINTRRTQPGLDANLITGYGSFNSKNIAGFINHKPGALDCLISADYLSSDNDFRILNNNGTPLNPDDDFRENRHNAQFDQGNILARLGYDINDTTRIDAMNRWFSKNQGLPSWNNSGLTDTDYDTTQNLSTFKLTADDVTGLHLNTSTQIDYFAKTEAYDDSEGHIGLGNQKMRYTTDRFGVGSFTEWMSDRQSLGIELTGQQEVYQSHDLINDQKLNKSERQTLITGFQDAFFFLDRSLSVTPAVRYQYIRDKLKYSISTDSKGDPQAEHYVNPQIGMKYKFLPELAFKSNLAQYDREPSFFELYGDRGIFVGNPNLNPESGINFDAGAEYDKKIDNVCIKNISLYGLYFFSDIDDLITRSYDARGIGKSENISDAFIDGIESGVTVDTVWSLRLIQRYTWQDTKNKSHIIAFDGNELPGRFENSWVSRAEYMFLKFKIFAEYVRESGMYYDTANLLEAETKSEVNSGISWIFDSWMLTLDAKNLTDDTYEDFNGYPLPGRSYFFTIKYSI